MNSILDKIKEQSNNLRDYANKCKLNSQDYDTSISSIYAETILQRVNYFIPIPSIINDLEDLIKRKVPRIQQIYILINKLSTNQYELNKSNLQLIEIGIRLALAIQVEGVSSSPEEGLKEVKEIINLDGSIGIELIFTGCIRGAGSSSQLICLIVADYLRLKFGYAKYLVEDDEIERYVIEIFKFSKIHPRQKQPSSDQIKYIVKNCSICISGDPSEIPEVDSFKFLRRITTPRIRGGLCLVITEGIMLKWRKADKMLTPFKMKQQWRWIYGMNQFSSLSTEKIQASYLESILAGRPLLSLDNSKGSLRLRIGRAINTGLGMAGISPITCRLFGFLNVGTQLKTSYPGKALGVAIVDSIEGPTVLLRNKTIIKLTSIKQVDDLYSNIVKIVDAGEILIGVGEFIQNNLSIPALDNCDDIFFDECRQKNLQIPNLNNEETIIQFCIKHDLTLLSRFSPLIFNEDSALYTAFRQEYLTNGFSKNLYSYLEYYAIEHDTIRVKYPKILDLFLNITGPSSKSYTSPLAYLSETCSLKFRLKGTITIGARMGRVESTSICTLKPKAHWLMHPGSGSNYDLSRTSTVQSIIDILGDRSLKLKLKCFRCNVCNLITYKLKHCNQRTKKVAYCRGIREYTDDYSLVSKTEIDNATQYFEYPFKKEIASTCQYLHQGLNGAIKIQTKDKGCKYIEPFSRGYLRAKYDLSTFKDGTCRFNSSNAVLTHFRCRDIGISIIDIKALGYERDYLGFPITSEQQIITLMPQDIIINKTGLQYLYRVTKYLDELCLREYNVKPYYNLQRPTDLLGHLILGLSPHTCIGVTARIIGWTHSNVCFAHPFYHAAKRRNADGDEDVIMLVLDSLLNFSYVFFKRGIGQKMNLPVFITSVIEPREIDQEAHNIDIMNNYPSILYLQNRTPLFIDNTFTTFKDNLNLIEPIYFTHDTSTIDMPTADNKYITIEKMTDKIIDQLNVGSMIRGYNLNTIVEKIIQSHFLPDLIGNMRTFLNQNFKCKICKTSYSAPRLSGKCSCGGTLSLTLYPKSVQKYRDIVLQLAENYTLSEYLNDRLKLLLLELDYTFPLQDIANEGVLDFL